MPPSPRPPASSRHQATSPRLPPFSTSAQRTWLPTASRRSSGTSRSKQLPVFSPPLSINCSSVNSGSSSVAADPPQAIANKSETMTNRAHDEPRSTILDRSIFSNRPRCSGTTLHSIPFLPDECESPSLPMAPNIPSAAQGGAIRRPPGLALSLSSRRCDWVGTNHWHFASYTGLWFLTGAYPTSLGKDT